MRLHWQLLRNLLFAVLFVQIVQLTALAQPATTSSLKPIYVKGKWGYADQAGRIVIAPQFEAAREFADGLAQVGKLDEELPEIRSYPNLKWGYIDPTGRVRVPLVYAQLRSFSEGLAAVAIRTDDKPTFRLDSFLWGYVNTAGEVVIPLKFQAAGEFSEGLANVGVVAGKKGYCESGSKIGYIDSSGTFVIQPQFANASSFKNGRATVSIGAVRYMGRCVCCAPRFFGKHGFIDKIGTFTIDPARKDTTDSRGWEDDG